MKTRRQIGIAALVAAALAFAMTGRALAQGPERTLSERGYEQMRRLAHDLDGQAQHANDQARHQEYWEYQRDRNFLRAVANFSQRAVRFHDRMDTYRAQPWQVDDELRALLRDARAVQLRLQRSRHADQHTVSDWNATVNLLNRMIRVYQADTQGRPYDAPYSRVAPPARPGYDRGNDSGYAREDRSETRDGHESRGPGRFDSDQIGVLAHDLAERAARVSESARQLAGPFPADERQRMAWQAISHFADQARAFHERVERGFNAEELRGNVDHLVADGREADDQVRRANVFPEIRRDWSEAMQLLQRIRGMSGV